MNDAFSSAAPWIWVGVMAVCLVAEAVSMSLTTIWFALGALVCVFLSLTPLPPPAQALAFALVSAALLALTRPLVRRKLAARRTPTNADSLVGRAVVLRTDADEGRRGEVEIGGVVWSAKSAGGAIAAGTECRVAEIRGNTLIVEKTAQNP